MYYLMYYKDKEHLDTNRFSRLSKVVEAAKKCDWANTFEVFADQWKTYKITGKIESNGDILWEGFSGQVTCPICKFMNKWIKIN